MIRGQKHGRAGLGQGQRTVTGQGRGRDEGRGKNTAVAGQKGRAGGRTGQGQGKGSGMARRLRRPIIVGILLSMAPKKGTLDAHKKRSRITYVTYMVVTPLTWRRAKIEGVYCRFTKWLF